MLTKLGLGRDRRARTGRRRSGLEVVTVGVVDVEPRPRTTEKCAAVLPELGPVTSRAQEAGEELRRALLVAGRQQQMLDTDRHLIVRLSAKRLGKRGRLASEANGS